MFQLDTRALRKQLQAKAQTLQKSARAIAQTGAQVYYDQVQQNVPVRSGLLKSAIYQAYADEQSSPGRALYHVSWNKSQAPHGYMLEFGTSRTPAQPFVRPAQGQASARATRAMLSKLQEVLGD